MRRHLPRLLIAPVALAAAAVVGLGASAHAADPATCGQPAIPAVYDVVVHPALITAVPAVTHQEWAWQRTLATTEAEHSRVVTPATGRWAWSRSVDVLKRQFTRTVVERAAVPAVVVTMWQYVQQQNGNLRWERAGWNAGDNGRGWSPTGLTRVDEVSPAVSELSHHETTWVQDGDAPPAGATATGDTRVAGSILEDVELPDGETPAGAGWARGAFTPTSAAVTEQIWLPEGDAAPAGYVATGATRPGAPVVERPAGTAALAPAGAGWTQVPGSEVTVVDAAAHDRVDVPAWTEQVLVSPAVPATEPCDEEEPGLPVEEPVVLPEDPDTEPVVDPVDEEVGGEVGGEEDAVVDVVLTDEGEVAGLSETRPAAAPAAALPATGAAADLWLVGLGAASVAAGTGLVRGRRTRTD